MARIKICIEEELVSGQQASFTVTVKPAGPPPPPPPPPPTPISIVPETGSLPDEQVGVKVEGDKLATVSGGVPPYTYSFSGQPSGMTFAEKDNGDGSFDVLISGTPDDGDDAKSPYTIVMDVTDSASPAASTSRSVNVNR